MDKEFASLGKQKDAESKKARADKSRLISLEDKMQEAYREKTMLDGFFKDLVDSFVVSDPRSVVCG